MATWPASVPATPLMGQYTEELPNQYIVSDFEVGPKEFRRRTTLDTYGMSAEFRLTRAQATSLVNFYNNTLFGGTSPFTWHHPRTLATVSVHFLEPPELTATFYDVYDVQVKFQVLP